MTVTSRSLSILGLLLLSHAVYSTHEHSMLHKLPITLDVSSPSPAVSLPLDIYLETLASVVVLCFGLVLGAESLKPIRWREWAGRIEREGGHGADAILGSGEVGMNPFLSLESRAGFVDVRAKRRDFAEWVREKDGEVGE
ncbi:MAG: hypothetical protein M1829_004034 [Trizodia sp. TS-e1964]|nr:MAG: hypothetical protein M1829_004034 [Trizodia sp. TS-e1964]